MLTGAPPDCVGGEDGGCGLPELPELPEEVPGPPLEPEEVPEPLLEPVELPEPPAGLRWEVPWLGALVAVLVSLVAGLVLVAACVTPGSMRVTAPAAATLATETPAVILFSSRLPRTRSDTARETGDEPGRKYGLLMPNSLPHKFVRAVPPTSGDALILVPSERGTVIMAK